VDGQVEGSIALKGNSLTVGPNGQVKASVDAKGVVVQGKARRQHSGQRPRRIA
jgi:cytoskeletal protein CcmA (bactofilin family)